MSTNTGLPPNWTIKVSKTHNKEYFFNQSTKESSWEPPYGTDTEVLTSYIQKFKNNGFKPVTNDDGKVRASHILVKNATSRKPKSWKSPEGILISRDEAISIAKKHLAQILSGEAKFADVAQAESDCSSHARGGDLGFFGKREMQPAFESTVYSMHVGEISDVIETDSGIHLVQRTG
ncbi:peptidyl-prolyl cis-trans isomerase 1 [Lodderomyces elongisporus NRRL YB-4239]|uniref:Peptidyl-prolyl cis-trans isomerase n=1 Tax=Lodderomyces elongisporus (strain ATCC 11503 / CBS 2605 / JCM 1781 / NBRC 1676 / NRRL YB-4239) TaxID=379508 RepID=A5DWT3_LODEL|nr:peptidyl-prolyl cis-trans isomerase 1 [Lodderomyces elongisporus NRRL YB-4239]